MADDNDSPDLGSRFDAAGTSDTDEADADSEEATDPESNGPDVTDETDGPHVPYGAFRTPRTPEGFGVKDIDASSVRDGATREIYMPQELLDELDLAYEELNLRYQREYGRSLHKHPHWYNRLLVIGLASIGDVGERDLNDLVDELGLPRSVKSDDEG